LDWNRIFYFIFQTGKKEDDWISLIAPHGCTLQLGTITLDQKLCFGRITLMTFDADPYVEESAQTWKYLDEKFARRRPIPIALKINQRF